MDGTTACDHMVPSHSIDGARAGSVVRRSAASTSVVAHLCQPPEQVARVVEHQPGLAAALDQRADEIGDAPVAAQERRRVVVVALPLVLEHVLQVRDQRRGHPVAVAEDGGLVHVQRDAEGGADLRPVATGDEGRAGRDLGRALAIAADGREVHRA